MTMESVTALDVTLNPIECRALACLLEKEKTTPEYYPMSLNSLTNACNQKSNRDPAMTLDDSQVADALNRLKGKRLVWFLSTAGGRVPKFEHNFTTHWKFQATEVAILCELMLRGPQTVGELRTRAARMHEFQDLEQVEKTLLNLSTRNDGPFVTLLARQAGRKEQRWAHLFCGEPVDVAAKELAGELLPVAADRMTALEAEVAALRAEIAQLRQEFGQFKQSFE
jgi:uncharacterized protein YceH (UPF0502 family)